MYQWQWEKCLPGQRNNSLQLLFGAKENLLLIVKGSQTWREIITSSAAGWERAQTRVSSLGISEWCLCVGKELPVGGDQTHLIPREKNSKKKKNPTCKLKQKSAWHQADGGCQESNTHAWLLHPPVVPTSHWHISRALGRRGRDLLP